MGGDEWRYRRADVWEYSGTALVAGLYAAVEFGVPVKDEPGWTGGILFDDSARDAFRLKSRAGRQRAADWSDATTLLSTRRPSSTTAAAVSSQDVSMPRINMPFAT